MNELVERLTQVQPVVVGGPGASVGELRRRLTTLGFAFVKFTGTRGGTDLGVRVDAAATDLGAADFENGTGSVHIEGTLSLDYVKLRCVADIDLATLSGTGRVVVLEGAAAR